MLTPLTSGELNGTLGPAIFCYYQGGKTNMAIKNTVESIQDNIYAIVDNGPAQASNINFSSCDMVCDFQQLLCALW
jgi:hypothetical protein